MTQRIGKGRLVKINAVFPIPQTATKEQVAQWISDQFSPEPEMTVFNPLFNEKIDPVKIDVEVTNDFVQFEIEDMEIDDNDQVMFQHSATGKPDNRTDEEIEAWKNRIQTYLEKRDEKLRGKQRK